MKVSIRKICLVFILLENLYLPVNLGFDFRFTYVLFALLIVIYPFVFRRITINSNVIMGLLIGASILLATSYLAGIGFVETVKQLLLIGFNLVFTHFLINAYHSDVRGLFKDYIDIIYFAAIIGLIQIVSMIVGFRAGADFSYLGFDMQNFTMDLWVIQSWFQEPSYLATAFLPVAFAAICRLMKLTDIISTQKAWTVLLVIVLSQAATGLIGIVLSIAIVAMHKYSLLRSPLLMVGAISMLILTSTGFYYIPKIKDRVDDTVKLFFDEHASASDIESVNASTYAIYSNFMVVKASFLDHPFVGGGLGTYERIYEYYIHQVMPPNRMTESLELNKKDANSLFLRLAAETGLLGLLTFLFFVWLFRVRTSDIRSISSNMMDYWIINSGVCVLIIVRIIRLGHYTTLGFVVFLTLYYMSCRCYAKARSPQTEPMTA